ncbi:MAG: ABC transporter ATP-binding protein [Candidatus Bathyarchaeia archaeon]
MPDVILSNITKRYGKIIALDHVNLEIKSKEYVTLLGPSGCGKTTLLKIIAGLVSPDEGEIIINGKVVNDIPPEERNVGFVFQNYALFPHMNLWENVTYGPTIKGWNEEMKTKVADEMLSMVALVERKQSFPNELSGGMQQRAALARALSTGTSLLLLDEPLGALDVKTRTELRYELRKLVKDLGLTAIHVTHDQEEAMTISDKIIVMRKGRIEQVGSPEELYSNPRTPFIANFIGESNFFDGSILRVTKENSTIEIRGGLVLEAKINKYYEGERVVVAIRPEHISLESYNPADINLLPGKIERIHFFGWVKKYDIRLINNDLITVRIPMEEAMKRKFNVGDKVSIRVNPMKIHVFAYPKEGLKEAIKTE